MKSYAQEVCGGVGNVKRMFVNELRRKRLEKGLSPEELDQIVGLGPDWPSIREMESDPSLFTLEFYQKLSWLIIEAPERYEQAFDLYGEEINRCIAEYLKKQGAIEEAIEASNREIINIHGTVFTDDPEEYIKKMIAGESVKEFHPNMLPPVFYATTHIFSEIVRELREPSQHVPV